MPPGQPRRKEVEFYKIDPMYPPVQQGQYLLDYFFRIGPTKGDKPIDGPELRAWEELLGVEWTPHQALTLLEMSKAYLAETHAAVKRDAPPPWEKFGAPWRWIQRQVGERRLDAFVK